MCKDKAGNLRFYNKIFIFLYKYFNLYLDAFTFRKGIFKKGIFKKGII